MVSPPLSRAGGRGQHQAHRILFMYVPSVSEPPARAAAQARRGASGQAEPTLRKERALLMSAARIWAAQLVEDVLPRSPAEQRELLEYGPAANGKKAIPGTE